MLHRRGLHAELYEVGPGGGLKNVGRRVVGGAELPGVAMVWFVPAHIGAGRRSRKFKSTNGLDRGEPDLPALDGRLRAANRLTPRLGVMIHLKLLPPSSSGLGYLVLSQGTGVRVPVGVLPAR
jgi:hypothetical protein